MSDYSELNRLAEAFPADLDFDSNTEPFFNGPSGESLGGGSTGFYSVYGKPFLIEGDDYEYDGPTYVEACNAEFAKFMVAARDGVLALIAENERLKTDLREQKDAKLGLSWAIGEIMGERDQLRIEVEALRKDAERYRWLNSDAASDSGMIPEFDGDNWLVIYLDNGAGGSGGGVCEAVFCSANEAVDFAMSKGDQS